MALELRQQLKLTQQLIMTPQLQMAIKLLQLSRLELMETIRQELEENPALEEVQDSGDETQTEPTEQVTSDGDETREVTIEEKLKDDVDWSNYLDEYNTPGRVNYESENKEAPRFDSFIAPKETLDDHLLWQLLMTRPTPEEEKIGSLIIGNLNRDGYLDIPLDEIAKAAGSPLEKIEQMLQLTPSISPPRIPFLSLSK